MGRLVSGSLIILFYIVMNVLTAYLITGANPDSFTDTCSTSNDVTTCESAGKAAFFSAVADVTVGDFGEGTPAFVSLLWILVGVFLLSMGVLLVVVSFIPTTSE